MLLLVSKVIPLFTISCILLSSSLLSTAEIYRKIFETRYPSYLDAVDSLYFSYFCVATDASILCRTVSAKLLTIDARLAALQQNVHAILKLLFGDYLLSKHSIEDYQAHLSFRLKTHSSSDTNAATIFDHLFINYDMNLRCLIVAKVTRNDQSRIRRLEYYQVHVRLPSVKILFNKMIAKGIDSNFALRISPLIVSSSEAIFKNLAPRIPNLTNTMNSIIKKFIWNYCQAKKENIEQPSLSAMKYLARNFFKMSLKTKIHTLRQGQNRNLYLHLISKPCTAYESKALLGIHYLEDDIRYIKQYRLPIIPSNLHAYSIGCNYYCIYTYSPGESNKIEVNDSKEYEQKATTPFMETTTPLMKVPDGTILNIYLVFSQKYLIDFLAEDQKFCSSKMKDINKNQDNQSVSSSSSMISDTQLCSFMNHFAKYLYTKANKDLFEENNVWY